MKKAILIGLASFAALALVFSFNMETNPYVGKCYAQAPLPFLVKVDSFNSETHEYSVKLYVGPNYITGGEITEAELMGSIKEPGVEEIDCETYSK